MKKRITALLLAALLTLTLAAAAYGSEEPAEAPLIAEEVYEAAESPAFDGAAAEGVDYGAVEGYADYYWFSSWEGLVFLLEEHSGDDSAFELDRFAGAEFTIKTDLDLTSRVQIDFTAAERLVIPQGVTVRCSGYMVADRLVVNGTLSLAGYSSVDFYDIENAQNVSFEEDSDAYLTKLGIVHSEAELLAEMQGALPVLSERIWSFIYLIGDWSITHSLTMPDHMEWQTVDHRGEDGNRKSTNITIAEGATLTMNGTFFVNSGVLTVRGRLVNERRLSIMGDNNASVDIRYGSYAGGGAISVRGDADHSVTDILKGFDMSALDTDEYFEYASGEWQAWYKPNGGEIGPSDPPTPPPAVEKPLVVLAAQYLRTGEKTKADAAGLLRQAVADQP